MGWFEDMERAEQIRDAQEYECAMAYKDGYEQAIEDFKAECHKQISKNTEEYGFNRRDLVNLDLAEIDMIAEQLKAGD